MAKSILVLGIILGFCNLSCASDVTDETTEIVQDEDFTDSTRNNQAPVYSPAPDAYSQEIEQAGTIEALTYTTNDSQGTPINKTAYVYLPYKYDNSRQYNILYLMHGGGGNSSTLMGNDTRNTSLKPMFDHMIHDLLIEPLIIVMPSFYDTNSDYGDMSSLDGLTHTFQNELRDDLIPVVEGKYSTYAQSVSVEGIINSRNHRAFSGFSMGGVTTWYALTENLAYFQYFIPSSGDCWAVEQMGGSTKSKETAEYIATSIKEQEYSPLELFIFAITGTRDMAYENMTLQINAMKELSDDFIYGYNSAKSNLYYIEAEDGLHDYDWYYNYLYVVLPYIF